MQPRVVLPSSLLVFALFVSAPGPGATLSERAAQIDAPTRGGVLTLSGPIQVGRAEIVPAKGTLVRSLMAGGVPCGLVVEGPAQHAILRLATDVGADLIIMGVRDRSAFDVAVFGSHAQAVVRAAHCPVLTVHQD